MRYEEEDTLTQRDRGTTGRFDLALAPAGLRLVQDLVNTSLYAWRGQPGLDLLTDLPAARAWLDRAVAGWSAESGLRAPAIDLREGDLGGLRELRESLRHGLRATAENAGTLPPGERGFRRMGSEVRLDITADGEVEYTPSQGGAEGVSALVAMEMLLARTAGTWNRLKTCATTQCGACFYDASPNRSRAWHSTKTCGNVHNLHASRARGRADAR
ncbi:CGNR zinc finger domain-containing protein [Streptomyces sp. SID1121]|uniref:CGNR zinc finger domain-containing protein n=1 Tax=Streptomyces sp. SID1121 TaxID=3425888 RepID=UPI004056358F